MAACIGAIFAMLNSMKDDARKTDVREILARHRARYGVQPYYDIFRPLAEAGPATAQRIQAGFDVDIYGTLLETEHLPLHDIEAAPFVLDSFEKAAQEIQSRIGQGCTVQVLTYSNSLVLDTKHAFRPEVMLRVRIGHCRGLDQAKGAPEEEALSAVRQMLREMDVREASE